MKKPSKPIVKDSLEFLNSHKNLVGFSDWKVFVSDTLCTGEEFATAETDIYEQTLVVSLSDSFTKLTSERQQSILVHELIHARVTVFKAIVEKLTELEEERLVNDLERGYALLL